VGRIYHPRAVIVADGSQLEPDLMIRPIASWRGWERAPLPILVVEILSGTTRRRDLEHKRDFYMKKGIPEYWVVDRYSRSVLRVQPGFEERITDLLGWSPREGIARLEIDVAAMFTEVLR
jgi:Uma2 family endonuclease